MIRHILPPCTIAAMLLVAGCSREPGAADSPASSAKPQTVSPARPQPLSGTDLSEAALKGELGCSFVVGRDSLLTVMGNVGSSDPAQGAIKVGDTVIRVVQPGGFNAMTGGGTFTGGEVTVRVRATGPSVARGEAPARPATLSYDRAGSQGPTIDGQWHCGP